MLNGECGHDGKTCNECRQKLVLQVQRSAAGYYLGTQCYCGPYSRESGYFRSREDAEKALLTPDWHRR